MKCLVLTTVRVVYLHRIHFTTLNTPGKQLEDKRKGVSVASNPLTRVAPSVPRHSHVTMSANKLLNRIVIPENVDYERETGDIAEDLHDYT